MNILYSPFIGKIKNVNVNHIIDAFGKDYNQNPKCVTSLTFNNGCYIDATSGANDSSFQIKRRLASDSYPLICKQLISREQVITIFIEALNGESEQMNSLEWYKNELKISKSPTLIITVISFLIFNVILITFAFKKLNQSENNHIENLNIPLKVLSDNPIYEIEYLDGKWQIKNKKSKTSKYLDMSLPLEDQLP